MRGAIDCIMLLQLTSKLSLQRNISSFIQEIEKRLSVGETENNLANHALAVGGEKGLTTFYFYLQKLQNRALISFTAGTDTPLATLIPNAHGFSLKATDDLEGRNYQLSRFCLIRREGERWILETPLANARLIIKNNDVYRLLDELKTEKTFADICNTFSHLRESDIRDCLILLLNVQAFAFCDDTQALKQWEFHDLFFHTRSRLGRLYAPFGGVFPFKDTTSSPPLLKPSSGTNKIELFRPDLEQLKKEDPSFAEVMEKRRSIRDPGKTPLNAKQLGEFLFRAARIKKTLPNSLIECAYKPYPSGGGIHELEIYPVIHRCEGVAPGIYHYDPLNHALALIRAEDAETEILLRDAIAATMKETYPAVLFVFSARFERISWKYRSIAYALILKHVGVLTQTMYLVATAMSLSPCAVGAGNSDLFANLLDSDYYKETSVGEFILS
ncbi:MAG: SagB family peptide dehydrogenase [Chlamydiales bacterium]